MNTQRGNKISFFFISAFLLFFAFFYFFFFPLVVSIYQTTGYEKMKLRRVNRILSDFALVHNLKRLDMQAKEVYGMTCKCFTWFLVIRSVQKLVVEIFWLPYDGINFRWFLFSVLLIVVIVAVGSCRFIISLRLFHLFYLLCCRCLNPKTEVILSISVVVVCVFFFALILVQYNILNV